MDIYDESLLEFWKSLSDNKVLYIMVGGFAVNMHGFTRTTGDIDIWLKDTIPNRLNFGSAMIKSGYDGVTWEEIKFVPGWSDFYIGPGIRLDIMIEMKGLTDISFDEALSAAYIGEIEDLLVPFLSINHLIANKKAVNRPKDQIDVIELEKIKKLKEDMERDNIS
jgi:hypothetical protein